MSACPHHALRAVTPDEEPDFQERTRRPFTCDDCNVPGLPPSRFTHIQVTNLFVKERRDAATA